METRLALKVEHLSVSYGKTPVLWDINLSVPSGQIIGILGPNGAGKSSLLKALVGLLKPLSGHVEFLGESYKKNKGKIAYVPQRSAVDWDFPVSVFDVVCMGCYGKKGLFRRIKKEDRELTEKALKQVGLESLANRQISELSGGQQQKVFIARALVQQAEIYLMDEPFAGIDMSTEKTIMTILRELKAQGKTIFVVHHDLNSVREYFDWVILLSTSLVGSGLVSEVFSKDNLFKAYGGVFSFLDERT